MTTFNMNCIERYTPYQAVNTPHLDYGKTRLQENNRFLFSGPHKTQNYSVWTERKMAEF